VRDRDSGLFDDNTWLWDTRWIGALTRTTDPTGTTTYAYAPNSFGRMGLVSGVVRTWTGLGAAAFDTTYDSEGKPLVTTWPDGTTVSASYSNSQWLVGHDVHFAGGDATVDYQYDDFGLPASWDGSETGVPGAFHQQTFRDGPTRVAAMDWERPDSSLRSVDYTWGDDGMLESRVISGVGSYFYDYDDLKRIETVSGPAVSGGLPVPLESYAFDPIGNPLSVSRYDEPTYTYGPARFSEVPGRTPVALHAPRRCWLQRGWHEAFWR